MDIKEQIEELRKNINKWSQEYYLNDNPSVSDAQYDGAYIELKKLESKHPELVTSDSPTQLVGGKVDNRFRKVPHKYSMLSLSNAFDEADLFKFDDQIKKAIHTQNNVEYVAELKIDGLSISITYINGKLFQALTRGDGIIGEDVTHNVLQISDIPKEIEYLDELEVRGEIYMSDKVFENLNATGSNFANPRNAAAGSLRQLDSSIAKSRKLSSFIYMIPNPLDHGLTEHSDSLKFLKKQGFSTNQETKVLSSINEAIVFINDITNRIKILGYESDGIVIKVNNNTLHDEIGYTVKFPKFMIAYKFPEEIVKTTLKRIFATIGRTGRVTYNAELQPVRLAGSTVSAATLHNANYIRDININEGDIVKVKKAGEIIPKVLGIAQKINNDPWLEFENCPSCDGALIRYPEEVDQYCVNSNCLQIQIAKLEHFTSRGAMNMDGISIEIIKTFISNGLITDIPSIFTLVNKRSEILKLQGFKAKSADNVIRTVEKAKIQDLDKLIFGLGIRHVGSKNAKIIARHFGSLKNIMKAKEEDLISIRDLGEKVSKSIVTYFKNEDNKNNIIRLEELGVRPKESEPMKTSIFEDMNFVVTGTLSKPRKYFEKLIESNNGNVSTSISRRTTYLLAGKNAGSKLEKASSLEVKVIEEKDFMKLIGGKYE